jgi:hypothetical protein
MSLKIGWRQRQKLLIGSFLKAAILKVEIGMI